MTWLLASSGLVACGGMGCCVVGHRQETPLKPVHDVGEHLIEAINVEALGAEVFGQVAVRQAAAVITQATHQNHMAA